MCSRYRSCTRAQCSVDVDCMHWNWESRAKKRRKHGKKNEMQEKNVPNEIKEKRKWEREEKKTLVHHTSFHLKSSCSKAREKRERI